MGSNPVLRIGVSMRVVAGPTERRDALAQDWGALLAQALPEACWMPLPNLGASILERVRAWDLNGLVLTGGEDLGLFPDRDATELALLEHALERGLPVLGVCRGFQLIQTHLGGPLVRKAGHVAQPHPVRFAQQPEFPELPVEPLQVNSFHGNVITALSDSLQALARAEDGTVEAACAVGRPVLGLMWHPEREPVCRSVDRYLLRRLFRCEGAHS